jgi:hypothetical protein
MTELFDAMVRVALCAEQAACRAKCEAAEAGVAAKEATARYFEARAAADDEWRQVHAQLEWEASMLGVLDEAASRQERDRILSEEKERVLDERIHSRSKPDRSTPR